MNQLISLIVYIVVFAVIAYGLWWVCQKFGLPQPVVWIVGAILLIMLLLFTVQQLGIGLRGGQVFPLRR